MFCPLASFSSCVPSTCCITAAPRPAGPPCFPLASSALPLFIHFWHILAPAGPPASVAPRLVLCVSNPFSQSTEVPGWAGGIRPGHSSCAALVQAAHVVQPRRRVGDGAASSLRHLAVYAGVAEDVARGSHHCWVGAAAATQRAQRRVGRHTRPARRLGHHWQRRRRRRRRQRLGLPQLLLSRGIPPLQQLQGVGASGGWGRDRAHAQYGALAGIARRRHGRAGAASCCYRPSASAP